MKRQARHGAFAAIAVASALAAPTAWAGPRVDYKQMFTTPVPGTSTGTDTRLFYKNPNDPAAKPIPVRREQFTFPDGTTYDGTVVPFCHASDLELMILGPSACPANSWIGGSTTNEDTSMAGFDNSENKLDVNAWNAPDYALLLGGSHDIPVIRFVTHIRRQGQVVTVDLPRSPGGPPDGESALRRIHHIFPAFSLGNRAYMRTPPTCPASGVWTFKAQFTFSDGVVENEHYDMPCQRPATAKPKAKKRKRHGRRHHRRHARR